MLYLVHNKIRRIENLDNNLALELLEIGDNRLRKIENVNHLKHLRQLYLGKNKIANIENIDALCSLTCLSLPVCLQVCISSAHGMQLFDVCVGQPADPAEKSRLSTAIGGAVRERQRPALLERP